MNDYPKENVKQVTHRLKSLAGQLQALINALQKSEVPEKIHHQILSCEKALNAAKNDLFDEVYRKLLAAKMSQLKEKCPGDCGNEDQIDQFLIDFPNLSQDQLLKKIKETNLLDKAVNEYLARKPLPSIKK